MGFQKWMQNEGFWDKVDQVTDKINQFGQQVDQNTIHFPGYKYGANAHVGEVVKKLRAKGFIVIDPRKQEGLEYLRQLYHYYFPNDDLSID